MEYEVEGSRPRGRPKRTRKEVVREDCQARKLNKEDAMDSCKWRKVIKEVRWPEWVWAGECFFRYRPTRVVPDKRPLNGCCCCQRWHYVQLRTFCFLCFIQLSLLLHPFNGSFSRTTWVSQSKKHETSLDLNEARDDGILGCSGINWTICKQSAPRCRQITTPAPHHSIFTGRVLFLAPKQQCQITEAPQH